MILKDLAQEHLIHPPRWLPDNTCYLAIVGSESYGANLPGTSDQDLQGFCIPPKTDVFPHLRGEIPGFGTQKQRFSDWQEHHIKRGEREYDFCVYSIVKFFQLAMENNPNVLDIICVPDNCVKHMTKVGQLVRDNRRVFFHAGCFHKFRGYASAMLNKIGKRDQDALNKFCKEKGIPESISYREVMNEIKKRELVQGTTA